MMKKLIAASCLLFTSLSSQAGIIYEWHGVSRVSPSMVEMHIEFDESVVASGSFNLNFGRGHVQIAPGSGLIAFTFNQFSYFSDVLSGTFDESSYFNMNVGFSNGYLTGQISGLDISTRFNMATSGDKNFTIFNTDSDFGMGDCAGPTGIVCNGGTGFIRDTEIPEPVSIGLLGLAAFAGIAARRRKIIN
jgi:hypothetical protein